jgi:hypothetical protein
MGRVCRWLEPSYPFRGQPIIPSTQFTAGGLHSMKPMAVWTWDQMGASSFLKWDAKAETTTEMALSAIPGLNRVVKISDYGYREQQWSAERAEDKARAQHRLAMPETARKLLVEYVGLKDVDVSRRTSSQASRYETLNIWYNSIYRKFDEDITLLEKAGNNDAAKAMRTALGEASKGFEK